MSFLKKKKDKEDSFGDKIEKEYEDQFSEKMLEILRQDDKEERERKKKKKKKKKKAKYNTCPYPKKLSKSDFFVDDKFKKKSDTLLLKSYSKKRNSKDRKSESKSKKKDGKVKSENSKKRNSKDRRNESKKKNGKVKSENSKKRNSKDHKSERKKKCKKTKVKKKGFGVLNLSDVSDDDEESEKGKKKEKVKEVGEKAKNKVEEEIKKESLDDSLDFVLSDDDEDDKILDITNKQKKESKEMLKKMNEKMSTMTSKLVELNDPNLEKKKKEKEKKRKKEEDKRLKEEERIKKEEEKKRKKEEEEEQKRKDEEEKKRKKEEQKKREEEERKRKKKEEKRKREEERKHKVEEKLKNELKQSEKNVQKIINLIQEGSSPQKIVNFLDHNQIDVNSFHENFSILHWICFYENLEVLKLFLEDEDVFVNIRSGKHQLGSKLTPLMVACIKGNVEIVKLLLSQNRMVDISVGNKNQKTAKDLAKSEKIRKMLDNYQNVVENEEKIISERVAFIQENFCNYSISTLSEEETIEELKTCKIFLFRSKHLKKIIKKKKKIEIEYRYIVEKVLEFLFGKDPKIKKTKLYDVFLLAMKWQLPELCYSIVKKTIEKINLIDLLKILNQILELSFLEEGEEGFEKSIFTYAILKKIKNNHYYQLDSPAILKIISSLNKNFQFVIEEAMHDDYSKPIVSHDDFVNLDMDQKDLSSINLIQRFFKNIDLEQAEDTNLELLCSDIGEKIRVHKEVISFRFQFFKKVLGINPKIDELIIDRFNFNELDAFIKFTYSFRSRLKENKNSEMLLKCIEFLDQDERGVFVSELIEGLKKNKSNVVGFLVKNGFYFEKIEQIDSVNGKKIRNFFEESLDKDTIKQIVEFSAKMNEKIVDLKNELRQYIESKLV